MNQNLARDDYDGRLKDLERRMHTLEDRHEDIVRAAQADSESVRTLDGNPPPATSVSDREREADEKAAVDAQHSGFFGPKPKERPVADFSTSAEDDLGMTPPKVDKKK